MTRKHFQAIALALFDSGADQKVTASVATALAAQNPRFDVGRFVLAAGHFPGEFVTVGGHFGPVEVRYSGITDDGV